MQSLPAIFAGMGSANCRGCSNMAVFVQAVRILFLVAISCCRANAPSLALEADASGADGNQATVPKNELENRGTPRLAMLPPWPKRPRCGEHHDIFGAIWSTANGRIGKRN